MAENEDVFMTEAQDQALLSRSQELPANIRNAGSATYSSAKGSKAVDDEERPLLAGKPSSEQWSAPDSHALHSRANALSEPWAEYEGRPWYRKPSVRHHRSRYWAVAELSSRFSGFCPRTSLSVYLLVD